MSWFKLSIPVAAHQVDDLTQRLEDIGAIAVTLTSGDERALFGGVSEAQQLWSRTWVAGLFDAALAVPQITAKLDLPKDIVAEIIIEPVDEQDWQRSWMQNFEPQKFGERLWVRPSWCHIDQTQTPQALEIVLDPGMAFGTGSHPTTHMCLQWLANHPGVSGAGVIDFGCGSGILALGALRLGAARVWAVDIDPLALDITRANADLNGLSENLVIDFPGALHGLTPVDIVVANILAGPLVELAPRLSELVVSGGKLVLAGITDAQVDSCLVSFQDSFKMDPPVLTDEWALLTGTRV